MSDLATTSFTPTPEQEAVRAAARDTKDNLLITALAGAAKTSTLMLLSQDAKSQALLFLAFNKKIAEELTKRLPPMHKAQTLNSLGHGAWAKQLGRRLAPDFDKVYRLLTAEVDRLSQHDKEEVYENFGEIKRTIDVGKARGYIPDGHYPYATPLMRDDAFYDSLDEEIPDLYWKLIRTVTTQSLNEAQQGIIDFNDQILMPTCFNCMFLTYPVVFVDEAQDLSALNHAMLTKVVKKRLIAVGDANQAIYGFRGAHANSMELLRSQFSMKELPLTVSFRCPIAVVEQARTRAPAMQYPSWAKPGEVRFLTQWDEKSIPEFATILCRNNAPLFSTAFKLLQHGRAPELVGNDIGKSLIKTLKKLGKDTLRKEEVLSAIDDWEQQKLEKARDPSKVQDQASCLRIFAERGATLGEAVLYAETLFSVAGPIKLMTGHKSKGLEFDDVFILDRHLLAPHGQDPNLLYVMQTRAKSTLTYIDSAGFVADA